MVGEGYAGDSFSYGRHLAEKTTSSSAVSQDRRSCFSMGSDSNRVGCIERWRPEMYSSWHVPLWNQKRR